MVDFWQGKKVLITGHTGFKGTWLTLWLSRLGATIAGYGLSPQTVPSLFHACGMNELVSDEFQDIRDANRLRLAVGKNKPEIIFHLAAQPLVRQSYADPVETYETNVMGTVNLLEAVRHCDTVRAVVIVTTDKVYENQEWLWAYREDERLGGKDPYSASKACAELVTKSYMESFFSRAALHPRKVAIATVRAGNIFGGGDWSDDRLVPDCLRALEEKHSITLRHPQSVRPWQHVLAPLEGYLLLARRLYEEGHAYQGAWNFGPYEQDVRTVSWVAEQLLQLWGARDPVAIQTSSVVQEARLLKVDSSKARARLGWYPRWDLHTSLCRTAEWHQAYLRGEDSREQCLRQIDEYEKGRL